MTYRDEFDDPPREGGFLGNIGPRAVFFILLIALSFMVGVVWKLYLSKGAQQSAGEMIPVIRADKKDFKAVPQDPGGMEIAHRDSTIFDVFKGEKKQEKVRIENLFAEDENEEPLPRSQLFSGLNMQAPEGQSEQTSEQVIARVEEV
ncbi:MAG: hypothetical protein MRY79_06715, partial [Alphaproteobacteria bacterium]|nr:hypothetical protein [Alphaproteobacteria bacterium]